MAMRKMIVAPEIIEHLLPGNSKSGRTGSYPRKRAVTLQLLTVLYTIGPRSPADFIRGQGSAARQSGARDATPLDPPAAENLKQG